MIRQVFKMKEKYLCENFITLQYLRDILVCLICQCPFCDMHHTQWTLSCAIYLRAPQQIIKSISLTEYMLSHIVRIKYNRINFILNIQLVVDQCINNIAKDVKNWKFLSNWNKSPIFCLLTHHLLYYTNTYM